MVYESEPRAGYCECDFNLTWYKEYLEERNEKLVNLGKSEEDIKINEVGLYNEIDLVFTRFVVWKVFGFKHQALYGIDSSDSWYEVLDDVVEKFVERNPDMWKLCDVDEDEEDEDKELEICDEPKSK